MSCLALPKRTFAVSAASSAWMVSGLASSTSSTSRKSGSLDRRFDDLEPPGDEDYR